MIEFNDFKGSAEDVMGCSAALAFVARKYKEELTNKNTGIDFFDMGFISTLDMLSLRLEQIAQEIDRAVEFHESPEGESVRKVLAAVGAKAVNE